MCPPTLSLNRGKPPCLPTASPSRIRSASMARQSNRRQFMQKSALAGAGFWVTGVVSDLYGDNPPTRPVGANDRINIGVIGAGGQGASNWGEISRDPGVT